MRWKRKLAGSERPTQKVMVYLTRRQYEELRRLAFEMRVSVSELIRRAIDQVYFPGSTQG